MSEKTVYTLIDGASFKRTCEDFERLSGEKIIEDFNWLSLRKSNNGRVIWYDALPVKKEKQSVEEHQILESEKVKFFNKIRSLENFRVRDGITRIRTKRRAQEMSEVLEQKGVDTWIAVDAMRLAYSEIADEIRIITSDSDLYPVFEALQSTRTKGTLLYKKGKATDELVFSADKSVAINFTFVWEKVNRPRGSRSIQGGRHQSGNHLRTLSFGDTQAEIYKDKNVYVCIETRHRDTRTLKAETLLEIVDMLNDQSDITSYQEALELIHPK